MAYQGLGQYDDALIAFSEGLAVDPKQSSSLVGLIDAMLKSPLKGKGRGGEGVVTVLLRYMQYMYFVYDLI